ncbi:hypothetical protein, partial [Bariatricus sp. HCP28S3_D3]|uniref:hypothetical protein n=1 Tax=Bariatricus sp. HCP28S3_D3 TaxID=3438901 RepID=UPI003F8CDA6D
VSGQFHYIKRALFMPFLLAKILNFQGTVHLIGVGSLSHIIGTEQNVHWNIFIFTISVISACFGNSTIWKNV